MRSRSLPAVLATLLLVSSGTAAGDDRAILTTAAEQFRANWKRADHLRCNYTITRGTAADVADLLAGRYDAPTVEAKGQAVRSGDRWCLKLAADEGSTQTRATDRPTKPWPGRPGVRMGTAVPFVTRHMTTDGKRGLNYTPQPDTANLTTGPDVLRAARFVTTHLYLDNPIGFSELADAAARGEVRHTDLATDLDGQLRVTFLRPEQHWRVAFTVDTRRGGLPVRREDSWTNSSLVVVTVIPEVAACGDGWFPTRLLEATKGVGQNFYLGWDFRLAEFEPGYRASDTDFELALPAGTGVCRLGAPQYFVRTKQPETVGHADFDRLWQLTADGYVQQQAQFAGTADATKPRPDTAVRPTWRVPWWGWWTGSLGIALLLAALVQFGRVIRGHTT